MKIAPPQRQGVQSMGRHSVGNTGLEGDIAKSHALTDAVSDLAVKSAVIMDKRQRQKADLFMQKSDSEFWKQWGGRDFFDVNELPAEVVTPSMEMSGRVASSEVMPKMYQSHLKTTLGDAGKLIDLPGSRNTWSNASEITGAKRLTALQLTSARQIDAQILEDQTINYTNAIEARRPEVAYAIAEEMNTTDEGRQVFLSAAKESAEIIVYEDMITEGRVEDMQKASNHLGQPVEDYEGSNGELDSTQRLAWKSKLDNEMRRIANANASTDKFYKAQLNHKIDQQTELSDKGYAVDMGALTSLLKEVEIANYASEGDFEAARLDMVDAILLGESVNNINKMGPEGRWQYINDVRNSNTLPQLTKDKLVMDLTEANIKFTQGLNTDFMGTAAKAGAFGPQGLAPINIMGNPTDMVSQFQIRNQQYQVAQQNYGTELGGGMFSVEEAKAMGRQLNEMSTQQQLGVINAANQAMGPGSVELFQQLGKDGDAGTFAIAGTAMGAGNMAGSRGMLDGRKWRMENGKELSGLNKLLNEEVRTSLGNAYINQPEKRKAVYEATIDAYYGRRQNSLDLTTLSIDSDDFNAALRDATGGMWEHAGKMLPVPQYGMDPKEMTRFIQDTSWENFKDSAPQGYNAEVFWNDVQAGRLTLEPYREPGTYTVSNNGVPLPGATVDQYGRRIPYLLRYETGLQKTVGWWNRTKDMVGNVLE